MGGTACKAKIILNGGTIAHETEYLCEQVEEASIDDAAGYKMVEYLNAAEDLVFKAKRVFLESQGFKGPWPKALQ